MAHKGHQTTFSDIFEENSLLAKTKDIYTIRRHRKEIMLYDNSISDKIEVLEPHPTLVIIAVNLIRTSNKPHVYLWRVDGSLTSSGLPMFYLGVNWKLKPYYTHSAQSSEEFCSIIPRSKKSTAERKAFFENPPKGISRHILKESKFLQEEFETFSEWENAAAEEMCILEHELLKNRKKRCWPRYYNESLGDPRFIDLSGKNNPSYKNGTSVGRRSNDPVVRKAANKIRNQLPERLVYAVEWERINRIKRNKQKRIRYAKKKATIQGIGKLDAFLV